MGLRNDMLRYTEAHLDFVDAACRPNGVRLMGEESPEYNRLEAAYNRLVQDRPVVKAIIGTKLGMRMLLWTS
jgi:hypothetical protein